MTQSSSVAVDLAFDSRTGVLVRLTGPEDAGGFEVLHLTEHGQLGAELFRWDGPSVDAPMSARAALPEIARSEVRRGWRSSLR